MPYLRPKTRRRVTILVLVASLVVLGGWIFYRIGQRRSAAALAVLRAKGMADYAAGDRQSALGELGDYLARGKQQDADADALFAYAMCRDSVELPGKRNLIEATGILAHYHQLRPTDLVAAHTLLEWYGRVHYHAEALALSESLLATAPADLDARLAKAKALWGLTRLPEALSESQRLNRQRPTLLKGQLMTTCLLLAMDRGDEAVRRAEALSDAHPNDARFEMLLGAADVLTGKQADARRWLAAAAARDTADSDFALEQCRFLDAAGLFDNARDLLARTAHSSPAPALVNQLLLRVYEDRGPAAMLDTLATLPTSAETSEAQGLKVISLFETHAPSPDGAGTGTNDAVAQGWSIAIAARMKGGDPASAAEAYREALRHDPGNVIVADWLADAYAQMGERELALAMWRSAAGSCPNWARPCIEMADTLEALGRPTAALEAAQAGAARAPKSLDAHLALGGALIATTAPGAASAGESPALPIIRQILHDWPGHAEVLPLYAMTLARGHTPAAAAACIHVALHSDASPKILLAMAEVNEEAHLQFGPELAEKLRPAAANSPAIALCIAQIEGTEQGLIAAIAAHTADPAPWEIALAVYRDAKGDRSALASWIEVADHFPNDIRVQSAAAASPSRFRDRAFWKRTIDRLHALVGDEGLTWRTEQARWILAGPADQGGKDKNLAEAVTLLQEVRQVAPDDADARHMLGVALRQTGNIRGAIDELTAAADVAPADWTIVADLSELLAQTGRTDEAGAVVRRLSACPMLSPAARRWADQAMLADRLHSAIAAGNLHEVETSCRQILARDQSPDACNDLAYALLLEGRSADRPEALRLARLAVNVSPQRAEYRDTLQRIEAVSR